MKIPVKDVELHEVESILNALHAEPLLGDIVPTAWHATLPACGDVRHGQKGRERKGEARRSVQHYINLHVLAYILSWYRPKPVDGGKAMTKRFNGHLLQINRQTLADRLRCTIVQ